MEFLRNFDYRCCIEAPEKGITVPDQAFTDDQVLELAQEIKENKGISLLEAMDIASSQLENQGQEIDCVFNLEVTLKPRVAKFFRETFSGHPKLSVEERLALFVAMQMNKIRGDALARTRAEADITDGKANTIRRSTFMERGLGG